MLSVCSLILSIIALLDLFYGDSPRSILSSVPLYLAPISICLAIIAIFVERKGNRLLNVIVGGIAIVISGFAVYPILQVIGSFH